MSKTGSRIQKDLVRAKQLLRCCTSVFLYICAIALLFFCITSAEASEKAIQKIDVEGLYSIEKEELLDILDIRTGDVFDPLKIRKGIKIAFLKDIFEDISVELDDKDRTYVKVKVIERDVIEDIFISGIERLAEESIRSYLLFKEGQFMRYDLIDFFIGKLKGSLSEIGFPRAEINLKVEKTGRPRRVNLFIVINEGAPEIIKSIKIYGPEDVRQLMELSEGDIYDQIRLRRDMANIKEHYKKDGFFNPSVGPYNFSYDELEIDISPGKKLDVIFEGNEAIGSKTLFKEMPFFDVEDFRDDLVDEAVSRLTSLYHSKGYPSVQIAPVITSNEDIISAHFFIFEGSEVIVNSISFSGITISEERLKEMISLKEGDLYNSELVDTDKTILIEFYNALGYLGVSIDDVRVNIKNEIADIAIAITEGEKTYIEAIEIKGAAMISQEEIKKSVKIKEGAPYNEVDISDARYSILDLYESKGLTGSGVDIKQEISGKGVKVIFEINEGVLTFFGKTVISGNSETKYEVIKRELHYKDGEPFNYSLLTKTRQRLYKLGLFTDVDIDVIDREANIKDVHIKVKEGNAGVVEFGFGYGDYEKLRGSFDVSYRNLFGLNKQISFRTELSSVERRYILEYLEPWFLDKPMPFKVQLMREERTEKNTDTDEIRYKLIKHSASAGFEKKLSEQLKGEIYYEFSLVKTFDVQPDVVLTKEDTGTVAISGIKPGLIYDTRDNPFDPRRGVLAGLSVKTATDLLLSETDFVKTIINWSAYKELSRRFVFAVALKTGFANGFNGTKELPLVERFFLGGRSTVRGYEQDMLGPKGEDGSPTGGNAFALTNIELRTSLSQSFGLVTFLDAGNVWVKTSEIDFSELKYTAGAGIRYNTPVGPVRVDYGYKLDREEGESKGEVHFSIGHAF